MTRAVLISRRTSGGYDGEENFHCIEESIWEIFSRCSNLDTESDGTRTLKCGGYLSDKPLDEG